MVAAGWEKQQLAFVDKVCIVDGRFACAMQDQKAAWPN